MTETETLEATNTKKVEEEEDSDDDEDYPRWIRSIRSKTGLETAIEIDWPSSSQTLTLSTCMEPDDIAPMFDGTQWAGTRVWRSSIVATQYLLAHHHEQSDQTLLELGCGLGVPGMILHALRGWKVVLTDKDPLPKQLENNSKTNFGEEVYGAQIQAHELDWSRDGVQELMKKQYFSSQQFDFVVNCDCVYEPLYGESWKLLVETMDELLRINPQTVMITSLERRKADGVDKFLKALEQSDHISKVERLDFETDWPEVQLYRVYGCL
ncbi:Putative methyltransferase [Seminavis robusta]|uniref:Methyltransferase n=1 Tax=Seminavis robusta TaxID=568900 RepID=A0A9N8E1G5_9STRA|nr:Putative methyltransferase [Seminavis robusta]|eukprot:Sro552_g165130.1 Putative methyltransferase (267) ;mRNA; f:42323-43123